jgi:drug/metabolite transporter (DMT)-like permease
VTNSNLKRSAYLPLIALAFLALIWGYNWVVSKVGVQYCNPFTFAALRGVLGGVALFMVVVLRRGSLRPQALRWTALYSIFQASFSGLILWAVYIGAAGKASVLNYTMPFWLLLLAWPVLGERIRGLQWVAVALALAGLVFVLEPWNLRGLWSSVLAIGGGIAWAISNVLLKIIRKRHRVELLSFTAWQGLLGSIPLIVVAALVDRHGPTWTGSFVAALVYNVIGANAIAWMLWMYILDSLPAGTAGINTLAVPVVGVLLAWLQLGERPGALEAVGMALIVAGLAVLTWWGLRRSRQTQIFPVTVKAQQAGRR